MLRIKLAVFTICLGVPIALVGQLRLPALEVMVMGGGSTYGQEIYNHTATGPLSSVSYELNTIHAGFGIDIWPVSWLALGIKQTHSIYTDGLAINNGTTTFEKSVPIVYDTKYTTISTKVSTTKHRLISFNVGLGYHLYEHYYEELNYGRKSDGYSVNVGASLNWDRISFNIFELNSALVQKSLFADFHDDQFYFTVYSGISVRIVDPSKPH